MVFVLESWVVLFSGRVQNVGFRQATLEVARGFEVVGIVENLGDGRVRVVAEGTVEVLDAFLKCLRQAQALYAESDSCEKRRIEVLSWEDFRVRF